MRSRNATFQLTPSKKSLYCLQTLQNSRVFIPSAQRELLDEGGEVSEGIFGQRRELRNVLDGSSSDDCGNGDGNGHQGL